MISPCTTEHSSATLPGPDSVIDAVCADPELLTLEFEAIMAANYPAPADHPNRRPPRTPPASATRQAPPGPPAHPATTTPQPPGHLSAPQRPQRARQRGPPTRAHRGLAFDPTTPPPERRCAPRRNRLDPSPPTANTPRLPVYARHPPPPRGGSSPPAPAPTALHHGDRPTQPNSSGRPSTPATTIQPSTQPTAPGGTTVLVGGTPPTRTPPPGAPVPCTSPARHRERYRRSGHRKCGCRTHHLLRNTCRRRSFPDGCWPPHARRRHSSR